MVANNNPYTECEMYLEKQWFVKETEKSQCFKLWGKKFIPLPKRFIKYFELKNVTYTIRMPKWFVEEHGMKSLMDKEVRGLLFPSKASIKAQESNLFAAPLERLQPIKPSLADIKRTTQPDLPAWMK